MWYKTWFDTPYYHILYDNRDNEEARKFISALLSHLPLNAGDPVLDLACGKGRHSQQLASMGLDVLGVDLSKESIAEAKKWEHEKLKFRVSDMRTAQGVHQFKCVFSLFTSFGYFDRSEDNIQMIESVYKSMASGGFFVLDFLNAIRVWEKFKNVDEIKEKKEKRGFVFEVTKNVEGAFVVKTIDVMNTNGSLIGSYEERVRLFSMEELKTILENIGFKVKDIFGDYTLQKFNKDLSSRCILIVQK